MLEIAEIYETIDVLWNDQKLSYSECKLGLDANKFEAWNVNKEKLLKLFAGAEPYAATLKYADFADFLVHCRWERMESGQMIKSWQTKLPTTLGICPHKPSRRADQNGVETIEPIFFSEKGRTSKTLNAH